MLSGDAQGRAGQQKVQSPRGGGCAPSCISGSANRNSVIDMWALFCCCCWSSNQTHTCVTRVRGTCGPMGVTGSASNCNNDERANNSEHSSSAATGLFTIVVQPIAP